MKTFLLVVVLFSAVAVQLCAAQFTIRFDTALPTTTVLNATYPLNITLLDATLPVTTGPMATYSVAISVVNYTGSAGAVVSGATSSSTTGSTMFPALSLAIPAGATDVLAYNGTYCLLVTLTASNSSVVTATYPSCIDVFPRTENVTMITGPTTGELETTLATRFSFYLLWNSTLNATQGPDAGSATACSLVQVAVPGAYTMSPATTAIPCTSGLCRAPSYMFAGIAEGTYNFGYSCLLADGRYLNGSFPALFLANSTLANIQSFSLTSVTLLPSFTPTYLTYNASGTYPLSAPKLTIGLRSAFASVFMNGVYVWSGSNLTTITLPWLTGVYYYNFTVYPASLSAPSQTYTLLLSRALSTSATLTTLAVGGISFSFNPTIYTYNLTAYYGLQTSSVTVVPGTIDTFVAINNVTALTTGNFSLAYGVTSFVINVTSQTGALTNIYNVIITRTYNSNWNNTALSALSFVNGAFSPAFGPGITAYTVTFIYPVASTSMTANAAAGLTRIAHILAGNSSSYTVATHPVAPIALAVGTTPLILSIIAEDNLTQQNITISLVRQAPSTDASLLNLTVAGFALVPAFNSAVYSYSINTTTKTTTASIIPAATAGALSSIRVNGNLVVEPQAYVPAQLVVGPNVFVINVTAQSGNVTTYTVTLNIILDTINQLNALTISEGSLSPAFSPAVTAYTADISIYTSTVTFVPTLASLFSSCKIMGAPVVSGGTSQPISLNIGNNNTVSIVVTSESGIARNFSVVINRVIPQNATALVITTQPTAGQSGQPFSIQVVANDNLGRPVLYSADATLAVKFTLSSGSGTLSGTTSGTLVGGSFLATLTFVTFVDNPITINATITPTGASTPITVMSAPISMSMYPPQNATSLIFGALPPSFTIGSPTAVALTVTIKDASGNTVFTGTDASRAITVSFAPLGVGIQAPSFGASGTATAVNGVATFNLVAAGPATHGNYTLVAQINGNLGPVTSNAGPVAVQPAAAAALELSFGTATSAPAGSPVSPSPTIIIRDAAGAQVQSGPDSALVVTLAVAQGSASAVSPLVLPATVAGRLAIPNLIFQSQGNYSLNASVVTASANKTLFINALQQIAITAPLPSVSASVAPSSGPSTSVLPNPTTETIFSVIPNSGPTAGGTSVTLLGVNFNPATAYKCSFGGIAASATYVLSASQILCITPASLSSGPPALTVSLSPSGAQLPTSFTFVSPATTSTACPTSTPVRCASSFCVASFSDCAASVSCPATAPYRCSAGSCAYNSTMCPALPNTCENLPMTDYKVCPGGKCIAASGICPIALPVCLGAGEIACANMQCQTSCEPSNYCPLKTPVMCPDGTCVENPVLCKVNSDGSIPCPDGSAVLPGRSCPVSPAFLPIDSKVIPITAASSKVLDAPVTLSASAPTAPSAVVVRLQCADVTSLTPITAGAAVVLAVSEAPYSTLPDNTVAVQVGVAVSLTGNIVSPFALAISFDVAKLRNQDGSLTTTVASQRFSAAQQAAAAPALAAGDLCLGTMSPGTKTWSCAADVSAGASATEFKAPVTRMGVYALILRNAPTPVPSSGVAAADTTPAPPAKKKLPMPLWALIVLCIAGFLLILGVCIAIKVCAKPVERAEDLELVMQKGAALQAIENSFAEEKFETAIDVASPRIDSLRSTNPTIAAPTMLDANGAVDDMERAEAEDDDGIFGMFYNMIAGPKGGNSSTLQVPGVIPKSGSNMSINSAGSGSAVPLVAGHHGHPQSNQA